MRLLASAPLRAADQGIVGGTRIKTMVVGPSSVEFVGQRRSPGTNKGRAI